MNELDEAEDAAMRSMLLVPDEPRHIAAKRIGDEREAHTLESIRMLAHRGNAWILDARRATWSEDQSGKDIVIITKFGQIFVQVKGSKSNAKQWRRKHGNTIGRYCVMVRFNSMKMIEPEKLRDRLLAVYRRRIREYYAAVAGVDISNVERKPGND